LKIDALLTELSEKNGSDLHLKVGRPPLMRINGLLKPTDKPPITEEELNSMLFEIMSERVQKRFEEDCEADFAYHLGELARFRVNVYRQRGIMGAVMRLIPLKIPTIDELGLPPILKEIALKNRGLVLFTGPTGCGKSTSMASMIDYMNHRRWRHVVSVEDPIEFVYTDDKCTINQRELGTDTKNFDEALKRILRQDPDVVLMGEMRDVKTMEFGLHASNTGHLVFSTLHTNDCKQTLDRLLLGFAQGSEVLIRQRLAQALLAVISQRLCKRADGNGRVAAVEVMVNTPHIQQLLIEGKVGEIEKAMKSGEKFYGMQTFNVHLAQLVHEGVITEQEAMENSSSPTNLKLLLKGFASGADAADQVRQKRLRDEAERQKRLEERRSKMRDEKEAAPPPQPSADEEGEAEKPKISRGFNL